MVGLYRYDMNLANFERRVQKLSDPKEQGSFVELYCLSLIYNVTGVIYREISMQQIEVYTSIDRNSPDQVVKSIYLDNNHYMALIEKVGAPGLRVMNNE